jgi:hypothetical protein
LVLKETLWKNSKSEIYTAAINTLHRIYTTKEKLEKLKDVKMARKSPQIWLTGVGYLPNGAVVTVVHMTKEAELRQAG